MIVVVAVLTGGDVLQAVLVALAAFVIATGWAWWKFRARLEQGGRK